MWGNREWAENHIRKHRTTVEEAWEAVFQDATVVPIRSDDQITWPPYRRYWTVGRTRIGKLLFVVWDQHREIRNLITAFDATEEGIAIYERKKKAGRRKG